MPTEKAYISTLDASRYCIGTGPEKYDTTGSPRYYSDMVVADIRGEWLVNQWTSEGVVIDGVAQNILMQQNRPGNTRAAGSCSTSRGLVCPRTPSAPCSTPWARKYEGCLSQVMPTRAYYWMNAS